MKLEKIKEGLVVANYPAMCELLEEQIMKGGKSKQLQLERWRKYFDWKNEGHKFIITKIRENPLPTPIYANDLYTEHISNIVCKMLYDERPNSKDYYTSNQLLFMCGFINYNYYLNERENFLETFVKENACSYNRAKYMFNKLDEHRKSYSLRALENGLKRLEKRKIIILEIVHIVKHIGDLDFCIATKDEENQCKVIYNQTKKRLGIEYINIYNKKKFYDEIDVELAKIGIKECYKVYRLALGVNSNAENITSESAIYSQTYINKKIYEKMIKYIDVDLEKQIKKVRSTEYKFDDDLKDFFSVDEYIEDEVEKINSTKPLKKALVDFYIKLQDNNTTESVEDIDDIEIDDLVN